MNILVVKLADIGDALLCTPALAALRDAFPDATIDALTTPGAAVVLEHGAAVDRTITFAKGSYDGWLGLAARPSGPIRLARALRGRYDAVVSFHHLATRYGAMKHAALALATGAPVRAGLAAEGSRRGWFLTHRAADRGFGVVHEVAAALDVVAALGVPAPPRPLVFVPGRAAEKEADRLLGDREPRGGPWVAIHPGSGAYAPARRWAPARMAAVADALAARGARLAVVGTAGDGAAPLLSSCRAPVLDLTGRTDLPTLAAVLARMDLLVGADSGVIHVATAVGTPVVAIYGPTSAAAWGPWWPGPAYGPSPHRTVELDLPCRPCLYRGHALGSREGCRTRDCLAWLQAGPVIEAAIAVLAARPVAAGGPAPPNGASRDSRACL